MSRCRRGIYTSAACSRAVAWSTFICDTAMLELGLHQPQRLGIRVARPLRHRQLLVEPAQLQVGVGDVGDERQDHAAPGLLGGEHVGLRRLAQARTRPHRSISQLAPTRA